MSKRSSITPRAQATRAGRQAARRPGARSGRHRATPAAWGYLARRSALVRPRVVDVDLHDLELARDSLAARSTPGATMRHGPHHGAHRSTTTGTLTRATATKSISPVARHAVWKARCARRDQILPPTRWADTDLFQSFSRMRIFEYNDRPAGFVGWRIRCLSGVSRPTA